MPEETPPSATAEAPETATADVVPLTEVTDFREYVRRRTTGESAPETKEEVPAAAEPETPQAKTVPDSDTAEDQEPEEEETDDDESEAEPAPKRPGGRQRRIDRLTRENEEFKRRLAEIEQREKPPPKKESAAEGEPQLEQFTILQDYQRALAKYYFDQARAEDEKARVVAKVQEAWDGKEKAARKAHTDYDDVIDSFRVPEGPGVMAARHAMLEDPHGAEILYYLGKHSKDTQRIASLDPINAVREIGRLSVMFDSSSSVPETAKRITSAPKPPPPVGRPARTSSDSLDDPEVVSDYPRWEKLRLAQLRRK